MYPKQFRLFLFLLPAFLLCLSLPQADCAQPAAPLNQPSYAKGIFLQQLSSTTAVNPGFQYSIELTRDGKVSTVSNQFAFRSGDQFRFHIRPNIDGYMYIVLKSGSTGESAVLFPAAQTSDNNQVVRGQEFVIPASGVLEFDNHPGQEILSLALSSSPLQESRLSSLSRQITISAKSQQNSLASNCYVDSPSSLNSGTGKSNEQVTLVSSDATIPFAVDLVLKHDPAGAPTTAADATEATGSRSATRAAEPRPSSLAAAQSRQPANSAIRDKWALLIGISKFKMPGMNLLFAAKDATDFANFLVKEEHFAADHVRLLTNEQATRNAILTDAADNGGWLAANVQPGDLVVVYVASHATAAQESAHNTTYLVAYDTNPLNPFSTGIQLRSLAKDIGDQLHTRVMIILDTCHASSDKSISIMPKVNLDDVFQGTGNIVLASCQADQVSYDSLKFHNGLFTKYLMDGLRQYKDLEKAFNYTQLQVLAASKAQFKSEQKPVLKDKGWQGKLVILSAPPTEPRPCNHN